MTVSIFFFDGPEHGWAHAIEQLGCPAGGTRPGHKHPLNDVELGAALARAVLAHETQGEQA